MSKSYSPNEPARLKAYRQLYLRIKDRLDRQDDVLMHLVQRIDKLQKRIEKLERRST
jgi:CII-binding regulator of phage lambda lysogenization HflD